MDVAFVTEVDDVVIDFLDGESYGDGGQFEIISFVFVPGRPGLQIGKST
jgi:hypothetical protein